MDSDPLTANATSPLSSDFRSAVSTSPLEQSLHNLGHLERACSAPQCAQQHAFRGCWSHGVIIQAQTDEVTLLLD